MGDEKIIRAKWSMDGAASLEEAAQKMEEFAATLRKLADEGWELDAPVADDYGFLKRREAVSG